MNFQFQDIIFQKKHHDYLYHKPIYHPQKLLPPFFLYYLCVCDKKECLTQDLSS